MHRVTRSAAALLVAVGLALLTLPAFASTEVMGTTADEFAPVAGRRTSRGPRWMGSGI